MKLKIHLFRIFILLFFFSSNSFSQLSQKHYIPPLTYADLGNANPEEQYIYISTPSSKTITFTIKEVGSNTDSQIRTVTKSNPQEIFIGNGNSQLFVAPSTTNRIFNNKGYIIESTGGQIYVSIRVRGGNRAQAGALVSKGTAALGKIFRAGMYTNEVPQSNYLNFISVMATENNTIVSFKNLPEGIVLENSTNVSNELNIILDEGESYILATNALDTPINRDGLIGTLIEADKNIVVNTGSANGSFADGTGRDYGLDQIVDLSRVGTEYIFVRGSGSDDWENVLLVAHEDNTSISLLNNVIATINSGEFYVIEGDNYSEEGNMFVKTSKPVFAYQGIGGLDTGGNPNEANQGMFFVPPLSCESRGTVDNIAQIDKIGPTSFSGGITIVTNRNANVLINDLPIVNFNPQGPNIVNGNENYVTYKINGLTGNISVKSSEELYCAYFNQNGVATSGSFYSGFLTAPEVNFNTKVLTLGSCIPNVTLEAANTNLFDSLQWQILEENNWNNVSSNSSLQPTVPGRYRLVGKINCNPDEEFISSEIPVSICPDDFDGDLIIDNLDIDLDNDGILNCDESFGDVIINLLDVKNGIAINPLDNTNLIDNAAFETTTLNNSITGTNSGDFTSTLVPNSETSSSYTLQFKENLNIELLQSINQNHEISQEEYFIIKINPGDKNITLLDPDDQLLVNTSFDLNQEFLSGITNISASEIWFKYKENINAGNSTFKFVANKVNQIVFEHKSNGITTNSIFYGNLKITCFAKDSDNDGIEDAFDNDSDNDGIPDFYESIALSGIMLTNKDTNEDGLDDIFETILQKQDTDNDGIPNYLDLDSDNDGIYDLIEAGINSNLDINNDGIIDNATTNSGKNGLYNPLEETVDSGKINFTINNSDIDFETKDNLFDFVDSDSDGDGCFDVIEAGFTSNGLGFLNPNPFNVNINGKVNNSDGYRTPNLNYFLSAPIIVTTPFENFVFCENTNGIISIDSNADQFTWFVSTDNGVNFTPILNDSRYTINQNNLTISNIPINFNNNIYKVILERNGNSCTEEKTTILNVKEAPLPNPVTQLFECTSNPNRASVNLSKAEINLVTNPENYVFSYFVSNQNAINDNNQLTKEEYQSYSVSLNEFRSAWVKITDKITGCSVISEIKATANFTPNVNFNNTFFSCDDMFFVDENGNNLNSDNDGISSFNFSSASQIILNDILTSQPFLNKNNLEVLYFENELDRNATINSIDNISNYRNTITNNQTIYIKIINKLNNNCQGIGQFQLQVNPLPYFEVSGEEPESPQILCLNNTSIELEAENPADDNYTYVWTNDTNTEIGRGKNIQVFSGGNYTVTAIINATGCSRSKTIAVKDSNIITSESSFITINDNLLNTKSNNLSIEIDVTKIGLVTSDYLYALAQQDGTILFNYQENPRFENIEGGIYKIFIENKDGCGVSEYTVSVIEIPKFFTPNNDGKNDQWYIKGIDKNYYSRTDIRIFNRFGKLIYTQNLNEMGWDGNLNGLPMQEDDYWYSIILTPTDITKQPFKKTGHFSLIRNN